MWFGFHIIWMNDEFAPNGKKFIFTIDLAMDSKLSGISSLQALERGLVVE